jgi:hypothetical protein
LNLRPVIVSSGAGIFTPACSVCRSSSYWRYLAPSILFKPQIDAFLDRDFDHLALSGRPKTLDERVEAALAANSNARVVGVELRDDPTDATRVRLMTSEGTELRVLVRPTRSRS